jgi:hypothetical protein
MDRGLLSGAELARAAAAGHDADEEQEHGDLDLTANEAKLVSDLRSRGGINSG